MLQGSEGQEIAKAGVVSKSIGDSGMARSDAVEEFLGQKADCTQ